MGRRWNPRRYNPVHRGASRQGASGAPERLPPLPAPRPSEEAVVAFFDMDRTLLTVNSARLWVAYERQAGRIGGWLALRAAWWILLYRVGMADFERVIREALALARGDDAEALRQRCLAWYRAWVRPTVSQDALARLDAHRSVGHRVAILTASTRFAAAPLAEELGVDLVATELDEVGGVLTGEVVEPLCFGEGKLARARAYCSACGASLDAAWFYTDSYTDLPVLEAVGHPVVVNPDPRLRQHAQAVGWPIVRFR
ncbi:MAG: HAD-IB family hydrolase [Deltaproteobacteria bacterium]|nr:MAG: HAD-IB family hydrolase [Deltaproteobacteria bacterium]